MRWDHQQFLARCLQQRAVLTSVQFSQLRIAADDQALAGEILVGKLEQIALVEQVHLDRTGTHQRANGPPSSPEFRHPIPFDEVILRCGDSDQPFEYEPLGTSV